MGKEQTGREGDGANHQRGKRERFLGKEKGGSQPSEGENKTTDPKILQRI